MLHTKYNTNNHQSTTEGLEQAPEKPHALVPDFEAIPPEIREGRQWMLWKYGLQKSEWKKPPYQTNGSPASHSAPTTWDTFDAVEQRFDAAAYDGIGRATTLEDTVVFIDLDKCFAAGEITTRGAREIVQRLHSYTELSPSKAGLRIACRVDPDLKPEGCIAPGTLFHGTGVEISFEQKYFTITGHPLEGFTVVGDCTVEFLKLYKEIVRERDAARAQQNGNYHHTESAREEQREDEYHLQDLDLIRMAKASRAEDREHSVTWGELFTARFDGLCDYDRRYNETTGVQEGDESRRDYNLCATLAWWTRCDEVQMLDIFMQSGCVRTDKRTSAAAYKQYVEQTIDTANQHCTDMRPWKPNEEDAMHEEQEKSEQPKQPMKFKLASEITAETTEWMWQKRIPIGKFTIVVGDPDMGKSLISTDVVARVTTGKRLPTGAPVIILHGDTDTPIKGGAVLIAPEDGESDTIVPRLIAAGADLTRVIILNTITVQDKNGDPYERPITLPEDTDIVREAIEAIEARVVVIDPIGSVIGGKTDSYKDPEVRRALTPLVRLADEKRCSVIGIMHVGKGQHANALHRSLGSVAFIALARTALYVVKDPDDSEVRVLVNHKNNLSKKAQPLCYGIQENEHKQPYVKWLGVSAHSNEVLLQPLQPTKAQSAEVQDIVAILRENSKAMSVRQIAEAVKLEDNEKGLDALYQRLKRKVEQDILWKPSRNLYTYVGNPLYAKGEERRA